MSTYMKFDQFVEDKAKKIHDLGTDQMSLFLTNVAPVKTNSLIADITEIDYTNLSPMDLTTLSALQTDGTFRLMLENLTLTASGGPVAPFRWVGVYNSTAANGPLIAWADSGGIVNLVDGQTFDITFDQTNGFHSET